LSRSPLPTRDASALETVSLETARRWYESTNGGQWGLSLDRYRDALETSVTHAFPSTRPDRSTLETYIGGLHHDDLALAAACADGLEAAWEHFMETHRPLLYRAADALAPAGGARDLADALYGDLYGVAVRDGVRRSLFHYFHGRSRLATWLRAVLAQRHVDRWRNTRDTTALPADDAMPAPSETSPPDPDRPKYVAAAHDALEHAVEQLPARDRLRLRCYYVQHVPLAAIGRMFGEHEATASRHLSRIRNTIRATTTERLRSEHRFDDRAIAECLRSVSSDPGELDLDSLFGGDEASKSGRLDRSR